MLLYIFSAPILFLRQTFTAVLKTIHWTQDKMKITIRKESMFWAPDLHYIAKRTLLSYFPYWNT